MALLDPADFTPEQLGARLVSIPSTRVTRLPYMAAEPDEDDVSFGEAARAAFIRENWLIEGLHEVDAGLSETGLPMTRSADWNPYTYLRTNYDQAIIDRLEAEISYGLFETAATPDQVERKVQEAIRDQELLRSVQGNWGGALVGGVGTALVDPTTYIPIVGWFAKGGQLLKLGKFALHAALSTGVSEVALQALQSNRTAVESFMNIGSSAVLAGGFGALAGAMHPRHPINPRNPNNPLHPDNMRDQGVEVRVPGEELGDSVGAMRTPAETAPIKAQSREPGSVRRFLTTRTPVGRALSWASSKARNIAIRMMDLGGILTDANLEKVATRHSAEDLKRLYLTDRENLTAEFRRSEIQLNQNLAAVGSRKAGVVDLDRTIQRILVNTLSDGDVADLAKIYGQKGADAVVQTARQLAERVHATNAKFEAKMVSLGILRNDANITKWKGTIEANKTKIDSLREADKKARETHNEMQKAEPPDARVAYQTPADVLDELDRLRGENDGLRRSLQSENGKAAAMGKDYGHAQLWDRETILANQEAFEEFMLRVLVDTPDAKWLGEYTQLEGFPEGLTPAEFHALKDTSPDAYKRILRDWAGEEDLVRIEVAEKRLAAAEYRQEQALLDLNDTMRELRLTSHKEGQLKLSEARKVRDRLNGQVVAQRQKREVARQEADAFKAAAEAARTKTLVRQEEIGPSIGQERLNAATKADDRAFIKADRALMDAINDPATPTERVLDAGAVVKTAQAAERTAERRSDAETKLMEGEVRETPDLAAAEVRAKAAAKQLAKEDTKLKHLEEAQARLEEQLAEVGARRSDMAEFREQLDGEVALAKANAKVSASNVRELKRLLRKEQKTTPLMDLIRDIKEAIISRSDIPSGVLDRVAPEGGRLKDRTIHLTPEQRRVAEDAKFLRTDLTNILYKQYDHLAGQIAYREALDVGAGKTFESWADVITSIERDYDRLLAEARDPATIRQLQDERLDSVRDMNLLKDRLLGMEDMGADRDGWLLWGSQKMRQANVIRFGGGFLLTSMTDLATVTLRHGFWKLISKHAREAVETMRLGSESEIRAFVNATELGQSALAAAKRAGDEDLWTQQGIGTRGSVKHQVTSKVDRIGLYLSDKVLKYSGLPLWNRFWKVAAGIAMLHRMRDLVARYDSLKPKDIADLASLGIGQTEATRLARFLEKYGQTDANGRFDPRIEEWAKEAGGDLAARDLQVAIQRDMTRAINTPGIGDTPRLMSKWYGKMLLQFQTFSFTFMNRFMTPAMQRYSQFQDARAVAALGMLAFSATMVTLGKDILNGRDPSERFKPENLIKTLHEVIDRSGLLGYTSPYVDSALKLTGIGGSDRYSRNSWAESVAGINAALLGDVQAAVAAVAAGDESALKKSLILFPFSHWLRLAHNTVMNE